MLKKLSLAAVIAMGTMSVASATPLTEAIKNVDLSGFLRIRFYNEDPSGYATYNRWRTNAVLIFKVPVSEQIKLVMRNSTQTNVYTNKSRIATSTNFAYLNAGGSNVDSNVVNNLLFMQYTNGPVNAILGKIPVATSITSADPATPGHGAGVIATYTVNNNLTVGAAFIDAMVNPSNNTGVSALGAIGNDTYAAVAVFNNEYVKGNAWYYHVTNAIKNLFTVTLNATPVKNLDVHVDFATGKADSKLLADAKQKNYYNISAKYSMDGICAKIGYAYTDKHNSPVELSADAPIGAVITTANNYNIANKKDTSSIYGKLGYMVDAKTSVYVAAQYQNAGKNSGNKDNDLTEVTLGGNYKYNKKLSFSAYYDIANWKSGATKDAATGEGIDNNEFRFQALYKF
ncbi:major outer membrane protein [Caminibacter sp.]